MEYLKLNQGKEMPLLGFGTFLLNGEDCENAVLNAIKCGYRLIDTAEAYGNEKEVGNAIKNSGISREEFYIVTKLNYKNYEKEQAITTIEKSLKNLQTDYIDLVILHWPFANYYEAYRVLEEYYKKGVIKAIGVSNFEADRFIDLAHYSEIKPCINQIETNILNQQFENNKWLNKYDIAHMGYAPFGQGKINEVYEDKILVDISKKYNKTTRQIVLRYFTQKKIVVIPKTADIEKMKENIDIFDFSLTTDEIKAMESLDKKTPVVGSSENPNLVEMSFNW
ncbi:MAG: aldo/keto reductase [Bacilli bacterium]